MSWQSKYWDTLDQVFWSLKYVGIASIPENQLVREGGSVSISEDKLAKGGRLYRRVRNAAEQREYLLSQEEPLNHVFDIAFGIAPDALIEDALLKPLGLTDDGSFKSIGREARERYQHIEKTQFQQQDGFFVSQNSAIGVELKLGSRSSPDQIMKYAMLLALEELYSGPRRNIGLLFITPEASESHWKACGLSGPYVNAQQFALVERAKSTVVKDFFYKHEPLMRSVLDRMLVTAISWFDFHKSLKLFRDRLGVISPGDQCLSKLIDGVLGQISEHKLTGLQT